LELYYNARAYENQTHVKPEAAITVFELLMMGGVSPLRNIGIINSTTRSHLVGSFMRFTSIL
jgi:hypothetical protein